MRHACAILLSATLLAGCATNQSPYVGQSEATRDTGKAQALTHEAADLIGFDPPKAEALLRQALAADLFHGPAHNNLGVIHLNRGNLYEAASEFEWARKLMPGHPDPRLNLGVALERAGRVDEAIDAYRTALDVYPGHLPTIQALVRCQVRHGRTDEQTGVMLAQVAMSPDARWRDWAVRQQLQNSAGE